MSEVKSDTSRSTHQINPIRTPRHELFSASATLLAFLLVFCVYGFWLGNKFLNIDTRMFDFTLAGPQLILSTSLVVCLACHQFDLSVGAIATLSVFLTVGLFVKSGLPMPLVIVIALLVGAIGGLINGLLVTKARLNAFIATLGTGGIYAGLTVVYSSGQVIGPSPTTRQMPSWFSSLGSFQNKVPTIIGWICIIVVLLSLGVSIDQRFVVIEKKKAMQRFVLVVCGLVVIGFIVLIKLVDTIAWPVVMVITVAFVLWIFLKYTNTGRSVYAIGGSPMAAKFAGIRTDAITILVFVISGTVAAFSGVLLAAVQGSAVPGIADALLLPAYAAVFLSTVLISRGRFHVWGPLIGGLFLVFVSTGLIEGGVSFTWTQVINGAVLVATVSLSSLLRRK